MLYHIVVQEKYFYSNNSPWINLSALLKRIFQRKRPVIATDHIRSN